MPEKTLLILKMPPPYGGGEMLNASLSKFFSGKKDFIVFDVSTVRGSKATQGRFSPSKVVLAIRHFFYFWKTVKKEKPSLIFLALPKSITPFLRQMGFVFIAKIYKIKIVGSLDGMSFYFLYKNNFTEFLGKRLLSLIDIIKVLGENIVDELRKFAIENLVVSDNGVSVPRGLLQIKRNFQKPLLNILYIGALSKAKGVYLLAQSALQVKSDNIPATFHLVGEWADHSDKKKISKSIENYKLGNSWKQHGILLNEKKWELFKSADILILPSYKEGQPLVILEALGCGLPIIATSVGAIPNTIRNKINGILVKEPKAEEFVRAIKYLNANRDIMRSMSIQNRRDYFRRFTARKYCLSIERLLKDASKGLLAPKGQRI